MIHANLSSSKSWGNDCVSAGDWEKADAEWEMNLHRYYIQQEVSSQNQHEVLFRDQLVIEKVNELSPVREYSYIGYWKL